MDFDSIVIGGGHAGIEACLALSRLNFSTLLITQSLDAIGRLSCNPAVGGLSKGNIVREVDALGGQMGKLIDASMIQFRILNKSRGPAVQAPRAQADKFLYSSLAKEVLEKQSNLHIFQDTVTDFILNETETEIKGVITERGRRFTAKTVVTTTGTFMDGKIFIGAYSASSGRLGEPAALGLGDSLRRMGFSVGRLKTGTPARVRKSSIDFSKTEKQLGDSEIVPFSFSNDSIDRPQEPCYITYSNDKTHEIIRNNIKSSPLYSGKIVGTGPRYCPSIEDKVMRFADRDRHQIFIEPEGLNTEEMYLNGISSSLPEEVQEAFLRTLPGLENLEIMRPGYAVEYDYLDPRQLFPNLETKKIKGLFIAGQTNGTSGYEEAACQGLMAGINAAMKMQGKEPLILTRDEAYTGVLIDDLVTSGTEEPYRMFTSRAEYRLCLRHDTADVRLLKKAYDIGLQTDEAMEKFNNKMNKIDEIKELLSKRKISHEELKNCSFDDRFLGKTFEKAIKDPVIDFEKLFDLEDKLSEYKKEHLRLAALDVKYEGYIVRQQKQVDRFKKMEKIRIPEDYNYDEIEGISNETREKLKKIRPLSVGQASRVSGIRPSDITVLTVLLSKRNK